MATHIQIGDISPRIQYTADGVQVAFTYPFPIFTDADVEVYEDATLKTLTTDYAVTGAGNSSGGLVTLNTAPASGVVVTLKRALAIKRTTDFQESGEFRAKVINDELDYQTAVLQQLGDDLGRGLRLAATDPATVLTLPDAATRASKYLGFDASGGPIATDAAGPTGPQGPAGNMDGANNLSELTAPATARSNLGLVIGADVLSPTGDGSGLTGIVTGATNAEKANIVLNAFRIAVNGGLSVLSMVDGVIDEFSDQTGVDTATSTFETYDAAGKYYGNLGGTVIDNYDQINHDTDNTMYAGNNEQVGQSLTIVSQKVVKAIKHYLRKVGLPTGNAVAKLYAATGTVGSAAVPAGPVLATSNNVDVSTFNNPNRAYFQFDFPSAYAAAAGDYCIIVEYTGGDATNYIQAGSDSTAPTHAGNLFRANTAGSGWVADGTNDLCFEVLSGTENMTLQSNASTALAQPDNVFAVLRQQDVDPVALNTDLTLEASRDGGVTWTAATLAEVATLGADRIITGAADISAQPVGTSMKWRLKTLNAKSQKIHAVGLEWS